MTGVRKPKSREAFDLNMNDAEMLVSIAKLLENDRQNRMRAELRMRAGVLLDGPSARGLRQMPVRANGGSLDKATVSAAKVATIVLDGGRAVGGSLSAGRQDD